MMVKFTYLVEATIGNMNLGLVPNFVEVTHLWLRAGLLDIRSREVE